MGYTHRLMNSTQKQAREDSSPTLVEMLTGAFQRAIVAILGDGFAEADPVIRPAQKPEFGDYQANGVMTMAKKAGMKPRELAEKIIAAVDIDTLAEPLEVAGPGFINIRFKSDTLAKALVAMDHPHLGVEPDSDPHAVAIDLCAVNVAKQMHVGHLRSTIIGDALGRIFERLGRKVYRENHVGDWGLPIAMVLHHLRESGADLDALTLDDLNTAYRGAQLIAKDDVRGLGAARKMHAGPHRIIELEEQNAGALESAEAAKNVLVKLQGGDEELVRDWHKLIDCTMRAVYAVFERLNVKLGPEHTRGESFYRDRLDGVIDAFTKAGMAQEDGGALVVRYPDRERPMLIRKSDGGYLYATTDLAAIRFRTGELEADELIYVVDARQRDHFRDLFDAARMIGWDHTSDGSPAHLRHLAFGSVLGPDKKPLKTRSGENVTLEYLLDEAIGRGISEVAKRAADPGAPTHGLDEQEISNIGRAVGIGAVKFADLSNDLVRDYVFNLDRMVTFEGKTGPYIQYAHARICSILARSSVGADESGGAEFIFDEPAERQLALLLLRYGSVVIEVANSLEPHRLCTYLYDLADAYNSFYQQCPVLKCPQDPLRLSRLRLCNLTRSVLADGLDLLGIEAPAKM